jgi:hypothetical protein
MQKELDRQEVIEKERELGQQDLDVCLNQIKELGEKLKKDKSYIQFGYVVKQDLIDVYKKEDNESCSSEDDVLLLI